MAAPFEVIKIDTMETHCDGGGGPLGHPRVYLHVDSDAGQVVCPYCSRTYVAKAEARAGTGH